MNFDLVYPVIVEERTRLDPPRTGDFWAADPRVPESDLVAFTCADYEKAGGDIRQVQDAAGARGELDIVDLIDEYLGDVL